MRFLYQFEGNYYIDYYSFGKLITKKLTFNEYEQLKTNEDYGVVSL